MYKVYVRPVCCKLETLMKEIKVDINKWRDTLHAWLENSMLKISILVETDLQR